MADKGSLKIDLLGTAFEIQANEPGEYLAALYAYYADTVQQLAKVSTVTDPLKTAIVAGILISDELFKERVKFDALPADEKTITEIERSTRRMMAQIDNVITG